MGWQSWVLLEVMKADPSNAMEAHVWITGTEFSGMKQKQPFEYTEGFQTWLTLGL